MTHNPAEVARSMTRFRVTHELTSQELEESLAQHLFDIRAATTPLQIALAAPHDLFAELETALEPLGRVIDTGDKKADLHIVALPWHGNKLFDIAELNPDKTPVLPLRFDQFSVSVGPLMDAEGPCPACALPAILNGATKPARMAQAQLFAAAASSCVWYVRALDAHASSATSLSVTIDSRTPRIEHRLWACLPGCRREYAA